MAIEDILNDYSSSLTKLGDIGSVEPYYKPKKEKAALTFREPVGPTASENNSTSLLGDIGREALVGVLGTGAGYIEHGRKLGLISDETATRWQREGQEVSDKIAEHYSPEQKAANQVETFDSEGNFHMPSIRKLGGQFVESLPTMLASVAPAAGATRVLGLAGLSKGVAASVGASTIEGLDAGAQNASQTRLKILDKPIEELHQSPTFLSTLSQTDPNLSTEQREEQAKNIMAENAASQVYKETAASTGLIGLATGGGVIGAMLGRKGITQGLLKTLGADMRSEGLQETLQSGGEAYIQNKAEKDNVDPNKNVWEGVLNQAVEGGLVGAASGGAFGVLHHVSNNPNNEDKEKDYNTNPTTGSKFVDKGTGDAYSAYVNTVGKVQDTTNPDYQAAFSAATTSLQNTIKEEQKKTNDPESEDGDSVKILEAEQALKSILKTHQTILDNEKKMRDEEEALVKANKLKEDADKVKEAADIMQEADDADSSIEEEVQKSQSEMTPDEIISSFPIGQLTEESKNRIVDAGLATHEDLGTILPKEPIALEVKVEEPTAPIDLQQGLEGMGKNISSDFYNKAFEGLTNGTHKISGVKDSVFKQLVPVYRRGLINSPEDVKNFLNKKSVERKTEYGVPVPDKENYSSSYFTDLMNHTKAKKEYEAKYGTPLQDLPPAPEVKAKEPTKPIDQESVKLHDDWIALKEKSDKLSLDPSVHVNTKRVAEKKADEAFQKIVEHSKSKVAEGVAKEPTVLSTPKAEPSSLQSVKDLLKDLKEHPEKLNEPVKKPTKTTRTTKPKVVKEEQVVEAPVVSKEDQEIMDLLSNQIEIHKQEILTRKEEDASSAELARLAGIILDHQAKLDAIKEKYPEVKEKPKRTRKVKEKIIEVTPKLNPKEVEVAAKVKKEDDLTKLAIDLEQSEEDDLDEDVKTASDELKLKKAEKEVNTPIKELSFEDQAVIDNLQEQIDDLSQQILDEKERFAPASEIQGLINDRRDLIVKMKTLKGEGVNLKPGRKPLSWGSSKEEREGQDDSGLSSVQFDNSGLFTRQELDRVIINHEEAKGIVGKIVNSLYSHIKEKVEIHYLEDFGWADWGERKVTANLIMARGLFVAKEAKGNNTGKAHIYLNGARLKTRQELVGTLAHELIGHFGLKEVFSGNEKYTNFLINMLNSSPQMREDIVALLPGWRSYLTDWLTVNKLSDLPANRKMVFKIKGESVEIPSSIAARLADEYMAELAKNKFGNEEFMRNEAGMGMKVPERSALMKRRDTWFNNFLRKITHYLRAIFGIYTNAVTPYDLTQAIAKSMDTLFHSLDPDMVFKGKNYVPSLEVSMPNRRIQGGELAFDMADETQLSPEDTSIQHTITHLEPGFIAGMNSTLGNHTETVQGRVWKQLQDKAASTPVLSFFHALGNMQFKDAYNGLQTIARGDIAKLEQFVKSGVTVLHALNPAQKVGVYKYFSTKDADPMDMDVTPLQREILVKNKEAIRTLGRHMYEAGLIPKDTYEKNEDAYLHIVYLKYIDMYRGSNKKTSVLSFLQKRKDKSEREKLALGMIKDPEFLVPETLGTMGRDVILLNMFSNISNLSKDNNLHWVIHKNSRVVIPGLGKTRVDIDDAYKILDEWNFIIDAHMKGDKDVFGTNSELGGKNIEWLIDNRAKLVDRLDNIQNEALQKAFSDAKAKGLTTTENVNDFLLKHYVRMPQKKQMGVLSNKWVRKEIANDLDAYTSSFTFGDNNAVEKFFSKGGTLERINRLWKLSMVALNPGSWFRNIAGNFALLDLSTNTNKLVLMKMLHEEVVNTFKNTPSNYWLLANEYGLFGATWSAVELQDFNNRYGDDLKRAKLEYEARNGGSAIDKQLHFLDERFLSIGRMLAHQTGAKTSKLYALVEGAFKTVSFRDYIQTWEAQNKEEFPRGIKDLDDTQKQIVYSKAAVHANEAIFDYSQVDGLTKTLRRIPFGAPFITFTMKALPASLKAMVNNPIKFAEYATLPMLLTMVAMAANDWDDDDITQFKKALPEYYKHNAGLTFLPFKYDKNDKDDKVQILSLDYVIPWSQWHNGIRGAYDIFAEDTGGSPTLNTLRGASVFANRLGFLGGPTPTALAAMLTGQDTFMEKPIMTPGASGSQQLGELMTYAYNMAAPPWLSSHGWFSKLADAYGIGGNGEPTVNAFGDVKFTPGQAWADITGFRSTSVNESGILANRKRYDAQIREIQIFRHKVIKDRNLSFEERAIELRAANDRLKLMKQQKADNT